MAAVAGGMAVGVGLSPDASKVGVGVTVAGTSVGSRVAVSATITSAGSVGSEVGLSDGAAVGVGLGACVDLGVGCTPTSGSRLFAHIAAAVIAATINARTIPTINACLIRGP